MKVRKYSISFRYERKSYRGEVQEWQPANDKMVRVSVGTGGKDPLIFIFYRRKKDELFWYDLPNEWNQRMAWKIATAVI